MERAQAVHFCYGYCIVTIVAADDTAVGVVAIAAATVAATAKVATKTNATLTVTGNGSTHYPLN